MRYTKLLATVVYTENTNAGSGRCPSGRASGREDVCLLVVSSALPRFELRALPPTQKNIDVGRQSLRKCEAFPSSTRFDRRSNFPFEVDLLLLYATYVCIKHPMATRERRLCRHTRQAERGTRE